MQVAGSKDGAATQKHVANNIFADSFKSRFTVINGKNPVEVFGRIDKLSKEPTITQFSVLLFKVRLLKHLNKA